MPRKTTATLLATRFRLKLPEVSKACMSQRIAALSSASIRRSGASRKSSALLVGGVSSTIRS